MSSKDDNFFYNSMLARGLVQLIPRHERGSVRAWFDKLADMSGSSKELKVRDEYMWFILMMLQCQKVKPPFDAAPPLEVPDFREMVSAKVLEEVLISNDGNVTQMEPDELNVADVPKKQNFKAAAPSRFYDHQPVPNDGIICYLAAFSDQSA